MKYDQNKVDEAVLALLYLTLHDVNKLGGRAWNSLDWVALDRLHEKELINPACQIKRIADPPARRP